MKACGIVVAAGAGSRMGLATNKALLPLCGQPLFLYALKALAPHCHQLLLVTRQAEADAFRAALLDSNLDRVQLVTGGATRRQSVQNALAEVDPACGLVLVHDAARPLAGGAMIQEVIQAARAQGAAVPALPVDDTLRSQAGEGTRTISREGLYRVQTPQAFHRELLLRAYRHSPEALSDDAGLVERLGQPVHLVPGGAMNFKITRQEDWAMAERLLLAGLRVGSGVDTHRLVQGRPLVLGGVTIPHETGLLGHSDADVALHALTDALLGACALGDIGQHFPDSDPAYRGASSLELLQAAARVLAKAGFMPWQCDVTILAQAPKLAPYLMDMRQNIAGALGLPLDRVSLKATTTEGLGPEGRGEGITAQAIAQVCQLG